MYSELVIRKFLHRLNSNKVPKYIAIFLRIVGELLNFISKYVTKLTKIVLKNRILGSNKLLSWSYFKRPKVIRPNLQNIDFKKLKNSKDENSLSRKKNAIVFFQ